MLATTILLAAPLALAMHATLQAHLGGSLAADAAAEGVNYDWWQEFTAQASGLGSSFVPAIIGFAATLDNISSVADGQREMAPVAGALALYVAAWVFLAGGILDRYARQRPTRASGFFAACGVFFWRFLRLAIIAGAYYWWAFAFVHRWLFDEWYPDLTRDISVEREAFAIRLALYLVFAAVLSFGNVLLDYAKIRAVVEDRRSMLGAVAAAARFVALHPAQAFGLSAVNGLTFLALILVWALLAPGVGGSGVGMWAAFLGGQIYVTARLLLKLHFAASQTALFQANLAHARYTAAPAPRWPESPAAETIATRA